MDGGSKELEQLGLPTNIDASVPSMVGVGAIALGLALRYYDISVVKDGLLYQQFKLENRTINGVTFKDVLETAKEIEIHLLGTSDRIAALVVDAIQEGIKQDLDTADTPAGETES